MYSTLLFDADGTLFDYDTAESKALAATFSDSGLLFTDDYANTYRRVNGRMWADFERGLISQEALRSERFALLFQAIKVDADPLAFSEAYQANLGRAADLIPGSVELLDALHGRYRLLLISNGIPEVQYSRLALSPLEPYFEAIIISGEIGIAKPHPGIFDAAFQAMGYPAKEETLIIGDSLTSDIQGGLNYGIDSCWYNPEGRPANPDITPTYEIRTLGQLLTIAAR